MRVDIHNYKEQLQLKNKNQAVACDSSGRMNFLRQYVSVRFAADRKK